MKRYQRLLVKQCMQVRMCVHVHVILMCSRAIDCARARALYNICINDVGGADIPSS